MLYTDDAIYGGFEPDQQEAKDQVPMEEEEGVKGEEREEAADEQQLQQHWPLVLKHYSSYDGKARMYGRVVVVDETGERVLIKQLALDKILLKFPHVRDAFRCHGLFGGISPQPELILQAVCADAGTALVDYIVDESLDYRSDRPQNEAHCSLLLHLHVLKLGLEFDLKKLIERAQSYFIEEIEMSCYTAHAPIHYCEAIRYLYTSLRQQTILRQSIAHYCVSCYSYHGLGQSEGFRQTSFQCPAFHKDLLLANVRSDFSSDSALDILNLPVCQNPVHQTHEAWTSGLMDFTCQFHDEFFCSRLGPGTPRQDDTDDAYSRTENDLRFAYTMDQPMTPIDVTPMPSSPAISTQGSWTDVDTDADWSDADLPPSHEQNLQEALTRSRTRNRKQEECLWLPLRSNDSNDDINEQAQQANPSTSLPFRSAALTWHSHTRTESYEHNDQGQAMDIERRDGIYNVNRATCDIRNAKDKSESESESELEGVFGKIAFTEGPWRPGSALRCVNPDNRDEADTSSETSSLEKVSNDSESSSSTTAAHQRRAMHAGSVARGNSTAGQSGDDYADQDRSNEVEERKYYSDEWSIVS